MFMGQREATTAGTQNDWGSTGEQILQEQAPRFADWLFAAVTGQEEEEDPAAVVAPTPVPAPEPAGSPTTTTLLILGGVGIAGLVLYMAMK